MNRAQQSTRVGRLHPTGKAWHRSPALPGAAALHQMSSDMLKYPNVVACFVGRKYRKDRPTRSIGIVCCVTKKKVRIRPTDRLPESLAWTDARGRIHRVPIDVEEIHRIAYETGPVAGPGDYVRRANNETATIGIAMDHPVFGPVITTAGHLFLDQFAEGEAVTVTSGGTAYPAAALRRQLTPLTDYTLIRIAEALPCDNLYLDQYPVRAVYQPTTDDLGTQLLILTADGTPRAVACRGVAARATIDGRPMEDLILTDWRTQPGDSGACLIDENQRAWGLLVGRMDTATYSLSAFVPAHLVLFQESGKFIYGSYQ